MNSEHYPFELLPLAYSYNALEPYIDAETVMLHHDRHLKTYVDNLNIALRDYPQYHKWSLQRLLKNIKQLPRNIQTPVHNNAGGVYNHNLYFRIMQSPIRNSLDTEKLKNSHIYKAINKTFGSFDAFKNTLKESGVARFGSGYAWLVCNKNDGLKILSTANQDTPFSTGFAPILLVDVWEHSYYLKYHNLRLNYLDNWFNLINWDEVENNFIECVLRKNH